MSEENKHFAIQKLYVKDVSLESPNAPHIFSEKWEPKVDFQLNSSAQPLQENLYEVRLTVTITVKLEDKTANLIEVCQAGIFTLKGFGEEELGPMLGIFCPNVLYPFAREVVSDLAIKGGFPPLLLAPVNFDVLYAQHLQQQAGATEN
jgi:preprotein translocase subunit SecB